MMDVDKYGQMLNQLLEAPEFDPLEASDISRLLKRNKRSVTRRFRLFFRIEIFICLVEIVQESFAIASAKHGMDIVYSGVNIAVSATFIFIFVRLLRKLADPLLKSLPLRQHTGRLLHLTKGFYTYYLRFMLLYFIIDFGYSMIRVYTLGMDGEYGSAFISYTSHLSPASKAFVLTSYNLLLDGLAYAICCWLLALFYRKGICRLQTLYDDLAGA